MGLASVASRDTPGFLGAGARWPACQRVSMRAYPILPAGQGLVDS